MVPTLDPQDLKEAAEEAGISPRELQDALVRREPGELALPATSSLVGPPARGASATYVEDRVAAAPEQALAHTRATLEKSSGARGHKQAGGSVDIVDDRAGITYRVRAEGDGADGALVRVDVDPSAARGERALATAGLAGVSLLVGAVGLLLSKTLIVAGIGGAVLTGLYFLRSRSREAAATRAAHAIAAQALTRTQHEAPALPPASSR